MTNLDRSFSVPISTPDKEIQVHVLKPDIFDIKNTDTLANVLDSLPGVYCFFDEKTIYIGESTHPFSRLKQHIGSRKLTVKDKVLIFRSPQFNKSAIYDIKTKLIDYMLAEGTLSLRNIKLNQADYNYFMKGDYRKVFQETWNQLQVEGVVKYKVEELEKKEIFKFSPFKTLNQGQSKIVKKLTSSKQLTSLTVVEGYPGTGKSIVASRSFLELFRKYKVCLTSGTHPTIASFERVFKAMLKNNPKGSKILKTSKLLKSDEKFDIVIVDEAHRLLKPGKGHGQKYAHLGNYSNELEMMTDKYESLILFYDFNQSVRDTDMDIDISDKTINGVAIDNLYTLREQMRSQSGDDFIDFIVHTLDGHDTEYKNEGYEVEIFDNFSEMYKDAKKVNIKHPLTRMLSGYTRPWISQKGKYKDERPYDFDIDGVQLRWNEQAENWVNSQGAKNLSEIGYYHTIQGFDLDYAYVIVGNDLDVVDGKLVANEQFVMATNDKPKLSDENRDEKLKRWIMNRYKVLLTRGARGLKLYFDNPKVKKFFSDRLK